MSANTYFLGRGDVFIADYSAGVLKAGKRFHCPSFELEVSAEYAMHKNSTGAIRLLDAKVATEQMGKLAMSLDVYDTDALAMILGGELTTDSGTSFSAKTFPSGLAVGDIVPIPGNYVNLASLALTDSTGSPVTLTLGTHYTVDLDNGLVTIVSLSGLTQPLKAAGATTAAGKSTSIATKTTIEKYIRFNGINIHDNSNAVIEIFRAQIPPTKFPLKTDGNDFVKFDFAPELLADPSAPFSEAFGQYGRFVQFA